jgi:hypothetical protein
MRMAGAWAGVGSAADSRGRIARRRIRKERIFMGIRGLILSNSFPGYKFPQACRNPQAIRCIP